jgi:hypothetical protein
VTSKRTKKLRDAKYEREGVYHRKVAAVIKKVEPILTELSPSVKMLVPVGPFGLDPKDFSIWIVFGRRADKQLAKRKEAHLQAREIILSEFRNAEYPQEALSTFSFPITSEEEIKDAGGGFYYFR